MKIYKIKKYPKSNIDPIVKYIEIYFIADNTFIEKISYAYTKRKNSISYKLVMVNKTIDISYNTFVELSHAKIDYVELLRKQYNDYYIDKFISKPGQILLYDVNEQFDLENEVTGQIIKCSDNLILNI